MNFFDSGLGVNVYFAGISIIINTKQPFSGGICLTSKLEKFGLMDYQGGVELTDAVVLDIIIEVKLLLAILDVSNPNIA